MYYKVYNVGFVNGEGKDNETQLDVEYGIPSVERLELLNLILSLKEEMGIKRLTYIDFVKVEQMEECRC